MSTDILQQLEQTEVSIILEKNFQQRQPDGISDFDALLSCVTNMESLTSLNYSNYEYIVNQRDNIEVAPGIFFQLVELDRDDKSGAKLKMTIRLSTTTLNISALKMFISNCKRDFELQRNNTLGDDLYYFDQCTSTDNKFNNVLCFTKQKFQSNKTFSNLFFEEKDQVEARVEHFLKNREWYVKKGIPHSYGLAMSGMPGVGKTSTVKAIANRARRHLINIRFGAIKNNTQLKNLFYNPILYVINPDSLLPEKINVPIEHRLYIIEDIDCMSDIVKKREYQASEPKHKSTKEVYKDKDVDEYFAEALQFEKEDMQNDKHIADEEEKADKITLDSILNILDGTLEIFGRMLILSSNHMDVLDPALLRPGRIDSLINFKPASKVIIKQMFENFYDQQFASDLFGKIKDYRVSQATVNQIMFINMTTPNQAILDLVVESNKRSQYTTRKKQDDHKTEDEPL